MPANARKSARAHHGSAANEASLATVLVASKNRFSSSDPGSCWKCFPGAAEDPASKPEPKRVLGMAIPAPVSAIGSKLNPAPVLRAGERMLERIVVAAKSVVPDFLR